MTIEGLGSMFEVSDERTITGGQNQLPATATLTAHANSLAGDLLKYIKDHFETYGEQMNKSKTDNDAMDTLILSTLKLEDENVDYLKALDAETLDKMLKSQQSKRSRSKGKQMTLENYQTMMTGAIAELLIRQAMGKSKGSGGVRGNGTYSDEDLRALAADQETLRKAIRNAQSKKSIMKSKAGFSEEDDKWKELCEVEETLKNLRTGADAPVDVTKQQIAEMLATVDIQNLKAADAKQMLATIAEIVITPPAEDEPEEELNEEVSEESTDVELPEGDDFVEDGSPIE